MDAVLSVSLALFYCITFCLLSIKRKMMGPFLSAHFLGLDGSAYFTKQWPS